ncbi:MAG: MmcQ/YjbR family DNA-binding protein [Candidatus Hydrogenedentes bacterium]|nr:MmcQ/YjbR family DNA-binding protein [Candidatus Hydrogenedentota bacterium]
MSADPLARVRRICLALPEAEEKLSHGEPTFFVRKKVFCMFANNHHNDGHMAVWLPAAYGVQGLLIEEAPEKFYKPPYVGVRGWIGVELGEADDEELASLIHDGWRLVAPKKLLDTAADSDDTPDTGRKRKTAP